MLPGNQLVGWWGWSADVTVQCVCVCVIDSDLCLYDGGLWVCRCKYFDSHS